MLRRIHRRALLGPVLAMIATGAGCGGDQDVLFEVNDTTVTTAAFEKQIEQRLPTVTKTELVDWVDSEIDQAVVRHWLLSQYPVELGARADRVRLRHCTATAVKRWMGSQTDLPRRAREWYDKHRSDYDAPERFVLQSIFLPSDDSTANQVAGQLERELDADPDRFDELARRHSRSETAHQGGRSDVIDADRLHPVILSAAREHADDDSVFRVDLDRGIYLMRVLGHVPLVPATWEAARERAFDDASRAMLEEFVDRAVVRYQERHTVRRPEEHLELIPLVPPSTVVLEIDGVEIELSDVLPVDQQHRSVSGPVAHALVDDELKTRALATELGCDRETESGDAESGSLLAIPQAIRRFAREEMQAEVAAFVERQAGVMRYPPVYRLTLVAIPVDGDDPYRVSQRVGDSIARLAAGGDAADAGALILIDLEIDESQLRSYEPRLAAVVSTTAPGRPTPTVISGENRAALGAIVLERRPPRPLDLSRPDDLDLALDWFLSEEREAVMDSATAEARRETVVDQQAKRRLIDRLLARSEGPESG